MNSRKIYRETFKEIFKNTLESLKNLELCPNLQTFLKKSLTKNFIKPRKCAVSECQKEIILLLN